MKESDDLEMNTLLEKIKCPFKNVKADFKQIIKSRLPITDKYRIFMNPKGLYLSQDL